MVSSSSCLTTPSCPLIMNVWKERHLHFPLDDWLQGQGTLVLPVQLFFSAPVQCAEHAECLIHIWQNNELDIWFGADANLVLFLFPCVKWENVRVRRISAQPPHFKGEEKIPERRVSDPRSPLLLVAFWHSVQSSVSLILDFTNSLFFNVLSPHQSPALLPLWQVSFPTSPLLALHSACPQFVFNAVQQCLLGM